MHIYVPVMDRFTDVMQYQISSFQINQKIFSISFARLSKSRKVHKNPLQTHKNVAPQTYFLQLLQSSTQNLLAVPKSRLMTNGSDFSKTQLPLELRRVLPCESPAVFLHFPLARGKGALGPLLSAPAGASKRETTTSNLAESMAYGDRSFSMGAP